MKVLKNIFLTHEGISLKRGLLLLGTQFNLIGFRDKTFYFKFWRLAIEQLLVSKFGKSLVQKRLHAENYLVIHTKWFGYFFWITDCLPKLLKTEEKHGELVLIYPEGWKAINYVNTTLDYFPELRKELIPKGVHMQIDKVVIPRTRKWSNQFMRKDLFLVRDFFLPKADSNLNLGSKIYISRSKALRRNFVNVNEAEIFIAKMGYSIVVLEDYDFLQQVSIVSKAEEIMGIHGAGLVNMVFAKDGAKIIELAPEVKLSDKRVSFENLAKTMFFDYECKSFPIVERKEKDVYSSSLMFIKETLQDE